MTNNADPRIVGSEDEKRAIVNALSHLETIVNLYKGVNALEHLEADGEVSEEDQKAIDVARGEINNYTDDIDVDDVTQMVQETPLSVEVRSGWVAVTGEMSVAEYKIVLSTGGPACQITGGLNQYSEPDEEQLNLQWQDWFKPWTDIQLEEAERVALMWFARQFIYSVE